MWYANLVITQVYIAKGMRSFEGASHSAQKQDNNWKKPEKLGKTYEFSLSPLEDKVSYKLSKKIMERFFSCFLNSFLLVTIALKVCMY